MSENKATLYKKMAQVMGQLSRVKETGRHQQQQWTYATSEDIKDAVRNAMSEAGLALLVSLEDHEVIPLKDKGVLVRGKMAFTLCCAETGATETRHLWGEAADQAYVSDKAFYKLYTTLEKYFLKTTFLISTGDDPDGDADDNTQFQPRSKSQSKSKSETAPPPPAPPSNGNGNGNKPNPKTTEAFKTFLARTRVELNLDEPDTRDILKQAGAGVFSQAKADELFAILDNQLNDSVTTETALRVMANRESDNYYRNDLHIHDAIKKIDPGFVYPPGANEHVQWQTILVMLIDHAQAGQEDVSPDESPYDLPDTDGMANLQ